MRIFAEYFEEVAVENELAGRFFVKRVFQGQGEESGRYACAALLSGFEVKDGRTIIKAPASWSEKDRAKWNAIVVARNKVSIEAFQEADKRLMNV